MKWHWDRFSSDSIIPLILHAHLHLYVCLTRRTSGRSLRTFQKATLFRKLEGLDRKVLPLLVFEWLQNLRIIYIIRSFLSTFVNYRTSFFLVAINAASSAVWIPASHSRFSIEFCPKTSHHKRSFVVFLSPQANARTCQYSTEPLHSVTYPMHHPQSFCLSIQYKLCQRYWNCAPRETSRGPGKHTSFITKFVIVILIMFNCILCFLIAAAFIVTANNQKYFFS